MSGPLIARRKSAVSGFLPTDVADCAGWWDAKDTATVLTDGGGVYQWNDKSGIGNNLTESTTKPDYTSGVSLNFTGANQDKIGGAISGSLPLTYFYVFTTDAVIALNLQLMSGFSSNNCVVYRGDNTPNYHLFSGSARNTGVLMTSGKLLIRATFSNAGGVFRLNAGSKITTLGTGAAYGGGLVLGKTNGFNAWTTMKAHEAIAYLSNVSDDDETLIREYLNDKWAIY